MMKGPREARGGMVRVPLRGPQKARGGMGRVPLRGPRKWMENS